MSELLLLDGVGKRHRGTWSLRPVDLTVRGGEVVVVRGPTGSGKSTLLMIAAGLDAPDHGTVRRLPPLPATDPRWSDLPVVPQALSLLPELTLEQNVWFAAPERRASAAASELLDALEIGHVAGHLPAQASRGEQQRAAVARALVVAAPLVVADEPTAYQDERRGGLVLRALRSVAERGGAVLMASHDPAAAGAADRELRLPDPG